MNGTVESWMEEPIQRFVQDAGVALALIAHPSGQVLGQVGFARAVDVMSACALAAAINASSAELGKLLDGKPFSELHQPGKARQTFLAGAETHRGRYMFLTVFDQGSSLGLVRMYFEEFRVALAKAAPPLETAPMPEPALGEHFERDLNRNLTLLFGKAS
jgi:hypothetical protein